MCGHAPIECATLAGMTDKPITTLQAVLAGALTGVFLLGVAVLWDVVPESAYEPPRACVAPVGEAFNPCAKLDISGIEDRRDTPGNHAD